jgi:hypothetical protein
MLVVVLNAWVIETNETVLASKTSTILGKSGQAIDLVDSHHVDASGDDIGEQALQHRPLHVAAGTTGVVVDLRQRLPPFVLLAADVRSAGLPLGVEGVELLFEPFLRRLAGIDRAADACARARGYYPPLAGPLFFLARTSTRAPPHVGGRWPTA